jgi:peptidoglycan-N-acetylglucosamine deacetylase
MLARAVASAAMAGYWPPALASPRPVCFRASPAPIWGGLRELLGIEDRTLTGVGYALTFDDGPHERGTPAVLDILAANGAPATFFLVGEHARRNPTIVREIAAAGHTLGVHCLRHRNLLRLTPRQVRDDLRSASAIIQDITGHPVTLYRPPYGVPNATALRTARANGWRTILWSDWGRDWEARATPGSIATRLTRYASQGSVGLLHDADHYSAPGSWQRTAAAVPRVLDQLAQRGLEPVGL